jgi:hypothetical protein
MANNLIQITRSGTAGAQPTGAELELGELALNYADGKLFYKDDSNNIQVLNDTFSNSGGKIKVNESDNHIGLNTGSPEFLLDLGGGTASTDNTLRLNQSNTGTAIRIGGTAGGDVTLLRVDNLHGETDNAADGFSIKYFGSNSDNEIGFIVDNGSSHLIPITLLQNGKIGLGQAVVNEIGDDGETVLIDGRVKIKDGGTIFESGPTAAPFFIENGSMEIGIDANEIEGSDNITIRVADGKQLSFSNVNTSANISAGGSYNVTNMIIKSDGDVGIGTISPSAKLDVDGSTNITQNLDVGLNLTVAGSATFGDSTADTVTLTGDMTVAGNVTATTAPTNGDHLTNKSYVDALSPGIKQIQYHQTQARTFETAATQISDETKDDGSDPIPQSNQGVEVGTVTITPVNANSILKITAVVNVDVDGDHKVVTLFKDDGANAIATSHNDLSGNTDSEITLQYIEVAGSTTARTYKYRAGGDGGDVSINGDNDDKRRYGGTQVSSMVIEEILNPS